MSFLLFWGRLLRRPFPNLLKPKNARRCSQSAFGLVNPVVSKAGNELQKAFSNFASGIGFMPRTHCGCSGVCFFPSEGRLPALSLGAVLFEHVSARMAIENRGNKFFGDSGTRLRPMELNYRVSPTRPKQP